MTQAGVRDIVVGKRFALKLLRAADPLRGRALRKKGCSLVWVLPVTQVDPFLEGYRKLLWKPFRRCIFRSRGQVGSNGRVVSGSMGKRLGCKAAPQVERNFAAASIQR